MTNLRVAVRLVLGVCASAVLQPGPGAQAQGGPAAPVDPAFEAVRADPRVAALLDALRADDAGAFDEQKRITAIPVPPFK